MSTSISVIIPAFNSATSIRTCLNSVLAQNLDNTEIICIDDGSTDNTKQILDIIAQNFKQLKIIHTEHKGTSFARNVGIRHSTGEYIAFMDSDDAYPNSSTLAELYTTALRNDADVCGGSWNMTDSSIDDYKKMVFSHERFVSIKTYQYDYGFQRFIYRRKLFDDDSLLFPPYAVYEDPVFFLNVMKKTGGFYSLPSCTYCYTPKPHSFKNKRTLLDYIEALSDCLKITEEMGLRELHAIQFRRMLKTGCWNIPFFLNEKETKEVLKNIKDCVNWKYLSSYGYKLSDLDCMLGKTINEVEY